MEMYYSVFNKDTGTNPNFVDRGLGEGGLMQKFSCQILENYLK